jgi:hypothetical protein
VSGCEGLREGARVSGSLSKLIAKSGFIELKISSDLHGERLWRRIATRCHMTPKGRVTRLAIWQSACVICGGPFEIATRFRASSIDDDQSFRLTTCLEHRMSRSETQKLQFAKATTRRAVFENIQKQKLAFGELKP